MSNFGCWEDSRPGAGAEFWAEAAVEAVVEPGNERSHGQQSNATVVQSGTYVIRINGLTHNIKTPILNFNISRCGIKWIWIRSISIVLKLLLTREIYYTTSYLLKNFPTCSEWQKTVWKSHENPMHKMAPKKNAENTSLSCHWTSMDGRVRKQQDMAINATKPVRK